MSNKINITLAALTLASSFMLTNIASASQGIDSIDLPMFPNEE